MSEFFQTIARYPLRLLFGLLAIAVLLSMTVTVVPETQQGLILRYGQIERVVNGYTQRENFGRTGAGLVFRIPFLEQIELIDKRVLGVELDRQEVLSTDQLRLQVDAYARYRIINPERMYESIRTEARLGDQLRSLLGTTLRNELGKRTFQSLLSPERGQMMAAIQTALSREAARYGAQVIDVRINRAELPQGSPRNSVYGRMQTAREQEARAIEAAGYRDAQLIRGEADGRAARIYADSFGQDPQFYAFFRAMKSYEQTFLGEGAGDTTFVLPPGRGYLEEFSAGGRR
jgi:modulator of FtsH protease HflC